MSLSCQVPHPYETPARSTKPGPYPELEALPNGLRLNAASLEGDVARRELEIALDALLGDRRARGDFS